jgi:hypothetical protein
MKKIPIMMISTVMLTGLLAGCGAVQSSNGDSTETTPPVEEIVIVDDPILGEAKYTEEAGKITIHYTAKNRTDKKLDLLFQNGMKVDYILYDQDGKQIEQYSKKALSTMAIEETSIQPEDILTQEFVLDQLPNGSYSIELFLNEPQKRALAVLPIEVSTSIYNLAIGTLVGRADLQSVEIVLDGPARVFQLTDFAKEQLMTIEDQTDVKFIYTENRIEQPTIEKFIMDPTRIHLNTSVLEVDSELAGVQGHIKTHKSLEALAGYQPFDVFRLYMYTKAGEDYETLYYFHPIDEDNLPVAKYIKENRSEAATNQNRDFMMKLNEVRDFQVSRTDSNRANISFKLPQTEETIEFKMMKGEDNTWRALWLPLQ